MTSWRTFQDPAPFIQRALIALQHAEVRFTIVGPVITKDPKTALAAYKVKCGSQIGPFVGLSPHSEHFQGLHSALRDFHWLRTLISLNRTHEHDETDIFLKISQGKYAKELMP